LRLDQTTFRGILQSYAVKVDDEKRQLIQGIDFCKTCWRSIMTRHTHTRDQQIEAHPDDTFYIIQDATLLIKGGDMDDVTLGLGDHLG
jgi:hypothetical protein